MCTTRSWERWLHGWLHGRLHGWSSCWAFSSEDSAALVLQGSTYQCTWKELEPNKWPGKVCPTITVSSAGGSTAMCIALDSPSVVLAQVVYDWVEGYIFTVNAKIERTATAINVTTLREEVSLCCTCTSIALVLVQCFTAVIGLGYPGRGIVPSAISAE